MGGLEAQHPKVKGTSCSRPPAARESSVCNGHLRNEGAGCPLLVRRSRRVGAGQDLWTHAVGRLACEAEVRRDPPPLPSNNQRHPSGDGTAWSLLAG